MLDVLYWFSKARSESTLAFRGESELQRSNFGSGFGGKQRTHNRVLYIDVCHGSKEGGFKEGRGTVGNFPQGVKSGEVRLSRLSLSAEDGREAQICGAATH